jgi:hypothetical protein
MQKAKKENCRLYKPLISKLMLSKIPMKGVFSKKKKNSVQEIGCTQQLIDDKDNNHTTP